MCPCCPSLICNVINIFLCCAKICCCRHLWVRPRRNKIIQDEAKCRRRLDAEPSNTFKAHLILDEAPTETTKIKKKVGTKCSKHLRERDSALTFNNHVYCLVREVHIFQEILLKTGAVYFQLRLTSK